MRVSHIKHGYYDSQSNITVRYFILGNNSFDF